MSLAFYPLLPEILTMHWLISISSHRFFDNPVYRFVAGLDPPSDERNSLHGFSVWLPNGIYIFIAFFFTGLLAGDELVFLAPFMAVFPVIVFYSFRITFSRPSFALHRENRPDLLMTALSPVEIMNGAAMSLYQAMTITFVLHCLLCLLIVPLYFSHPAHLSSADVLSILVLDVFPCFCLLTCAALAPPLWVLAKSKLARGFLISVTMCFLLWVHLFIFAGPSIQGLEQRLKIYGILLPFWTPLLGFIIFLLWHDAIRELRKN